MNLFKVERYNELKEETSCEEQLRKLKLKIEERKQRKYASKNNENNGGEFCKRQRLDSVDIIRKKVESIDATDKKKKRKSNEEEQSGGKVSEAANEANVILITATDLSEIASSKKKKKRKSTNEIEENGAEKCEIITSNQNDSQEKPVSERTFPILGKQKHMKLKSLKRTLPRWLAEPSYISPNFEDGKVAIEKLNCLSQNTLDNLKQSSITMFFPVQASVIPHILRRHFPPGDVCVEAPTGSGKTLSYVLPVVEHLKHNLVCETYCLVVLPTKDLALQVKQVFDEFVKGTNLKVGLVCGVKTLEKERSKLVGAGPREHSRLVQILIATPGRLVDHLNTTEGFSLKHLRFLVIDEADRLLGQDYSGWLDLVLKQTMSPSFHPSIARTFQSDVTPFQKMLFSATLTQNPEKLAPLKLFKPVLFTSKSQLKKEDTETNEMESEESCSRFTLPEQLKEGVMVVEESEKPIAICHLMSSYKRVLCFTKSIEATHRLYLLLEAMGGMRVAEFSSNRTETQRKAIIRDFKGGAIDLLVSSDAMSRGMDIDHVNLVVNYDPPANIKTYVHRVGRTARAGNEGMALTILTSKEVFHFKKMHEKLSTKSLTKTKLSKGDMELYEKRYEEALSVLRSKVIEENKLMRRGLGIS